MMGYRSLDYSPPAHRRARADRVVLWGSTSPRQFGGRVDRRATGREDAECRALVRQAQAFAQIAQIAAALRTTAEASRAMARSVRAMATSMRALERSAARVRMIRRPRRRIIVTTADGVTREVLR